MGKIQGQPTKNWLAFTADFVDFESLCKARMKEEGEELTTFGIVVREGRSIQLLPEERSKLRLFGPLTGRVDRDEESASVSAYELLSSMDEIR